MSWKQAEDIRKAPQAGSERCPRCASSDRNGECFAPTGAKDTPRHPWHFPPESGPPIGDVGGSDAFHDWPPESGKEGETNANFSDCSNNSLHSDRSADGRVDNRQPLTPSPAQGAEELAQRFHEAYERLAPQFGYETRRESAKPWADVPESNRKLMTAVCSEILAHVTAAKDAEIAQITRNRDECAKVFEIDRNHELTGPHIECGCPSCNLRREVERLKRALAELVHQIDLSNAVDDYGHHLKNLRALAVARAALSPEAGGGKS